MGIFVKKITSIPDTKLKMDSTKRKRKKRIKPQAGPLFESNQKNKQQIEINGRRKTKMQYVNIIN